MKRPYFDGAPDRFTRTRALFQPEQEIPVTALALLTVAVLGFTACACVAVVDLKRRIARWVFRQWPAFLDGVAIDLRP